MELGRFLSSGITPYILSLILSGIIVFFVAHIFRVQRGKLFEVFLRKNEKYIHLGLLITFVTSIFLVWENIRNNISINRFIAVVLTGLFISVLIVFIVREFLLFIEDFYRAIVDIVVREKNKGENNISLNFKNTINEDVSNIFYPVSINQPHLDYSLEHYANLHQDSNLEFGINTSLYDNQAMQLIIQLTGRSDPGFDEIIKVGTDKNVRKSLENDLEKLQLDI